MGFAMWVACGSLAFALSRFIRLLRPRVAGELATAIIGSIILGGVATALDFGGWNELEWRAALFVFIGTLACIAVQRFLGCVRELYEKKTPEGVTPPASPAQP